MKLYYEKKVKQGMPKMNTINIIRIKISSTIFAVVQRDTPYVDTMKYFSKNVTKFDKIDLF